MHKLVSILILLSLSAFGKAQSLYFHGSIIGMADEDLVVEYPEDWFGTKWKDTLRVSKGKFSKDVEIPGSGWLTVFYKDKERSIYVWNGGDSLGISFEADFLDDKLETNGSASVFNPFAQKLKEKFGSRFTVAWLNEQAAKATNIDAMEMDAFALRNDIISLLNKVDVRNASTFKPDFKNHVGYFYYLSLFKFSKVKTASSTIPKATEVPKVLLEGLTWDRMNNAEELESSFFRDLLLDYVEYKALESYDFMKFSSVESAVQESFNLAREELKGKSLNYYLAATLLNNADRVSPSLLRQILGFLKKQADSELFNSVVEARIAKQLSAKDEEVVKPIERKKSENQIELALTGLDGKEFELADLQGKVVYMDVWASWCGPCRKQFPYAKELKAKFSKKELKKIVFLYISIDNTQSVWKAAIEKLGIEGTHGLSQGGWGSKATAVLGINSIPRYMILDKNGDVVDPNAPRPSDPNLYSILKKLATE